jgi:hypothetical protein
VSRRRAPFGPGHRHHPTSRGPRSPGRPRPMDPFAVTEVPGRRDRAWWIRNPPGARIAVTRPGRRPRPAPDVDHAVGGGGPGVGDHGGHRAATEHEAHGIHDTADRRVRVTGLSAVGTAVVSMGRHGGRRGAPCRRSLPPLAYARGPQPCRPAMDRVVGRGAVAVVTWLSRSRRARDLLGRTRGRTDNACTKVSLVLEGHAPLNYRCRR